MGIEVFKGILKRSGDSVKLGNESLPDDFRNGDLIDGVLFSRDATKFAYVAVDGKLVRGDVPPDGVVHVELGGLSQKSFSGSNLGNVHISNIKYADGKLISATEVKAPRPKDN